MAKMLSFFSQAAVQRTNIDKKTPDRIWKLMEKVLGFCTGKRMNLKNSPPFILDILPDTFQHIRLIFAQYDEAGLAVLAETTYFKIFIDNLTQKCKQTIRLFKDAKERIYDESSTYRRHLTKHSLIFSHMLAELKALFPNGMYCGDNYRLTKQEATDFWRINFNGRWAVSIH